MLIGGGKFDYVVMMNPIKISPKQKKTHRTTMCLFLICFETAALINYNDANFIQSAFSS